MIPPFARDAEFDLPSDDRRQEGEAIGLWVGRRHYPLSRIGKGLLFWGSVVGLVAGCFVWSMQAVGARFVSDDAENLQRVADTALAGLRQSRANEDKVDSLARAVAARITPVEQAVQMLAELKCKELRSEGAVYLPPTCTAILREAAR